jgi:hypothetical protein
VDFVQLQYDEWIAEVIEQLQPFGSRGVGWVANGSTKQVAAAIELLPLQTVAMPPRPACAASIARACLGVIM